MKYDVEFVTADPVAVGEVIRCDAMFFPFARVMSCALNEDGTYSVGADYEIHKHNPDAWKANTVVGRLQTEGDGIDTGGEE